MKMNERMKKVLSFLLAFVMVAQYVPVSARAAEDGLCPHHETHTAECGYVPGSAEVTCTHQHDGQCSGQVTSCLHTAHDESCGGMEDETLCQHSCTAESGCLVTLTCQHKDDGSCCYAAAVEGQPCGYDCQECAPAEEPTESSEPEITESSEPETTAGPVCECGTDDATHAANCPAYVAPEDPECRCELQCTEANEWCPVCWVDYTQCGGAGSFTPYVNMTGGEVLYLQPNNNWKADGARFAIYVFGSDGNAWASMTKSAIDGIYEATVPSGSWTNVIFCRMSGSSSTNSWNTKWNQTGDLTYDGTNNLCAINEGQWDCGTNVTWSVYTPPHVHNQDGDVTYDWVDEQYHFKFTACKDCPDPEGHITSTSEEHIPRGNTFTNNGDSTHSFTCYYCGEEGMGFHSFEPDGTCACGAVCTHNVYEEFKCTECGKEKILSITFSPGEDAQGTAYTREFTPSTLSIPMYAESECGFAKTGHYQNYWVDDNEETVNSDTTFSDLVALAGNSSSLTLTARWLSRCYNLYVQVNNDNNYSTSFNSYYGDNLNASLEFIESSLSNMGQLTKTGHTLTGWKWYADSEFTTVYTGTTMPAHDLYMVGQWTPNTYSLTLKEENMGVELKSVNGEAVTEGEPINVTYGKDVKLVFDNTASDKREDIDFDVLIGYQSFDNAVYPDWFTENTVTIPRNQVTGDIQIGACAYVAVQVNMNGGGLTGGAGSMNYTANGSIATLNDEFSTVSHIVAINSYNFTWEGHALASVTEGGTLVENYNNYAVTKDAVLDINWTCNELTYVDAKASTCVTEGNIAHYACACNDCGRMYADAEGTTELTEAEVTLPIDTVNGHSFGTDSYCIHSCGTQCPHTEYDTDHKCTACGAVQTYTVSLKDTFGLEIVRGTVATHGQELKIVLDNTASKKTDYIECQYVEISGNQTYLLVLPNMVDGNLEITVPADKVTGNMTVHATPYIQVTLAMNGGARTENVISYLNNLVNECTYGSLNNQGDTVTLTLLAGELSGDLREWVERPGYSLNSTTINGAAGDELEEQSEDADIVYSWTPNIYTVTWMNGDEIHATTQQTFGENLILPTTNPTRVGYKFYDWSDANGYTVTANTAYQTAGNATYYANFVPCQHDNVTNSVCQDCGCEFYQVWVQGIQVNSLNAADVLNDGTVSYTAGTKTLTLNNATITGGDVQLPGDKMAYNYGIAAAQELNLVLKGNNTINAGFCIDAENNALTISGGGSASLIGETYSIYMQGSSNTIGDNLTISGVTISSAGNIYSVDSNIKITGSNVQVNDEYNAIYASSSTIDIINSSVTATSSANNGIFSDKDIEISNSIVSASGANNAIRSSGGKVTISGDSHVKAKTDSNIAVYAYYGLTAYTEGYVCTTEYHSYTAAGSEDGSALDGSRRYLEFVANGHLDPDKSFTGNGNGQHTAQCRNGCSINTAVTADCQGETTNMGISGHGFTCSVCNTSITEAHTPGVGASECKCGFHPIASLTITGDSEWDWSADEEHILTANIQLVEGYTPTKTHYYWNDATNTNAPSVDLTGIDADYKEYTCILTVDGFAKEATHPVHVKQVDPTYTPPTAVSSLVYDGNAHELVTPGSSEHGTLMYKLTYDGEFTTAIPTATKAGDYTVYWVVDGDQNHKDTIVGMIPVSIAEAKSTISEPPTPSENLIYNAGPQPLVIAGTASGGTLCYKVGEDGTYSTDIPSAANAGTYDVYYKVVGDENHEDSAENGPLTTVIDKAMPGLAWNGFILSITYGETIPEPTVSLEGTDVFSGEIKYSYCLNSEPEKILAGKPTDADSYSITASIAETANYYGNSLTVPLTIAPKAIDGADITVSGVEDSYSYTGEAILPNVTVKLGDKTLTEDDFEVTYGENTKVSTGGSVTVTLKGNYSGIKTVTFAISKVTAQISQEPKAVTGLVYDGGEQTLISAGSSEQGTLLYSLEEDGTYTQDLPKGTQAVEYTVWYYIQGDENHLDSQKASFKASIAQKELTPVLSGTVTKVYDGTTAVPDGLSITLSGIVINDDVRASASFAYAGADVGTTRINATNIALSGDAAKNYTLKDTTASADVGQITKANPIYEVPTGLTATYGDTLAKIILPKGFTWEDAATTSVGNAGTHTFKVTYTPDDTGNYNVVTGIEVSVAVTKAALTITAEDKVIYIGEALPTLTYTVSGLVTGDSLTTEPTLTTNANETQAGSYTITAANADAGGNYAITYVNGTLTIMDKNTEVETKVEKTALTAVPDGLKNTEFNTVEAIKQELTSRIVAASTGYSSEKMEHYDVTLQFSLDGGNTWILATEENFPTEGITVTLPYPAGTNAESYDFVVSHMFTVTSQRLRTTAGAVELPKVEETASGIRVTLSGLSPVTVAWKATEFDVKIAGTTNGTVITNVSKAINGTEVSVTVTPKSGYKMATITVKDANGVSRAVSTDNKGNYYFAMPSADVTVTVTFSKISSSTADPTNPKTGDDFQLAMWSSIMCITTLGIAILFSDNKRRGTR